MRFSSLSRTSLVASSIVSLLAFGCGFQEPATSTSGDHDAAVGGAGGGSPIIVTLDGGTGDAARMPAVCPAHCPSGQVCLAGQCQPDPCMMAPATTCATGTTCRAGCVPIVDRCAGVTCAEGQTCVDGSCIAGCFAQPCNGVTCPAGQSCNAGTGKCVAITACDAACGPGMACALSCLAPNPCAGVTCAANQLCSAGKCIANACAGVSCPIGSICSNGTCLDTCHCSASCGPEGRCIQGACVCTPNCPADGSRGNMPDGCGKTCPCPSGETVYQGACCTPNCPV